MRSRTSDWFEVVVRYSKTQEDGIQKMVTEKYVVDALTFTEAEARITEEMKPYVTGELYIKAIARATYHEVFFSDQVKDGKWYKAKLCFVTLDEKSGKEKRPTVVYLVQASSLDGANKNVEDIMFGTMIDYESVAITETPFMDVFEHIA